MKQLRQCLQGDAKTGDFLRTRKRQIADRQGCSKEREMNRREKRGRRVVASKEEGKVFYRMGQEMPKSSIKKGGSGKKDPAPRRDRRGGAGPKGTTHLYLNRAGGRTEFKERSGGRKKRF